MKKLYIFLALVVVSFMMVFAGDTIKVLRIYHNGTFTAIPLAIIDSIDHSRFDVNGKVQTNYATSIIETLDSTYNIPLNEIDSVSIIEADYEKYLTRIESIQGYVSTQGGKEVEEFQKDLMSWLNKQDWITFTSINNNRNLITITLDNGIDFYIDFQDASFFDEPAQTKSFSITRFSGEEDKYFDVSYQKNEKIIDNSNILLIQGRTMFDKPSYQAEEYKQLNETSNESPVDVKMTLIRNSFNFLKRSWANYGMILISQTHGADDFPGAFQVMELSPNEVRNGSISIYVKNNLVFKSETTPIIWWVKPHVFPKLSPSNNSILYLNYCDSYGASNYVNSTLIGFPGWSFYYTNERALNIFMGDMLDGNTYDFSFEHDRSLIHVLRDPVTNNANSKQRYFSIRTDSLTNDGEIVGRINGYDKLKKDIKWVVYVHDGSDEFKPSDEGVEEIQDVVEVKADGSFKVKSDVYYDNPWSSYIVAFKYNGKVYYGGQKYAGMCPNENHPHKRDLGLSVKWACCNVGATMPFEIGYFYQWGDNERFYEWSNKEYKYWKDNNHKECKFIGYNISGNPDHDGATHLWGKHWRMPTVEECEELLKNCVAVEYNEWYEVLGRIKGDYVFSNKNGNWMFLPYYWNSDGGYWTGNAVPENERKDMWQEIPNFAAYSLILNEPRQTGYIDYEYQPFIGQDKKVFMASIRPVYVEYADE